MRVLHQWGSCRFWPVWIWILYFHPVLPPVRWHEWLAIRKPRPGGRRLSTEHSQQHGGGRHPRAFTHSTNSTLGGTIVLSRKQGKKKKREKEITPALRTACIQVSYFETGSRSHFSRFVPQMSLQEFAIKLKKYWSFFFCPQVSSYGGFLTYQTKSFGIPSEGMTLMDRRPDVVLTVRSSKDSLLNSYNKLWILMKQIDWLSTSLLVHRARTWLLSTWRLKSHFQTDCIKAESSS